MFHIMVDEDATERMEEKVSKLESGPEEMT
jgi:hypothetical protein